MNRAIITPARAPLAGKIVVPGDKSISHRRALLSLFLKDAVCLEGFNPGSDCASTLDCLERLGKRVVRRGASVEISGRPDCPSGSLDCGNSGTTARMLMGILAGRTGEWTLRGDDSLCRRPMMRVAEPLRAMGAHIELLDGRLPAKIRGTRLRGIEYSSPVASAQVKSAILFAGLQAEGITRYREPLPTRDHTERLLGLAADAEGWITLDPQSAGVKGSLLRAWVPGDSSAAAFWVAAALLVPGSEITIGSVLLNPRRTAFIECLQKAGGQITLKDETSAGGEPVGDIVVRYSSLGALRVDAKAAAQAIDEIPVLAVLASTADGVSEFHGVGELRVKESDRLALVSDNLRRMGVHAEVDGDRLMVCGPVKLRGSEIETGADHRMAMAFAVAGLVAAGRTEILDANCVAVSCPEFWLHLDQLAQGCVTVEP